MLRYHCLPKHLEGRGRAGQAPWPAAGQLDDELAQCLLLHAREGGVGSLSTGFKTARLDFGDGSFGNQGIWISPLTNLELELFLSYACRSFESSNFFSNSNFFLFSLVLLSEFTSSTSG